jgi:rhodanese-related sulfurtransferase/rubrerythrin|uniref:Sulfurtransferase n=1 Tax=Desulfobacca acetoxidans TaxID=60893 RepID=A0A7V6A1T2_9BACT
MIELKKLFTPTEALDADGAKKFMESRQEGTYTLLDVRQPWEYEEDHIPGAKLVPLGELKEGTRDLDPAKPILVYCAVGGRSRVAAQLLSGRGFKEVYNLSGGIKAFRGAKASGPQELNLDLVRGDESPRDMLKLAYGLERALGIFYDKCQEKAGDKELLDLFAKLGHVEDIHKKKVYERYTALVPDAPDMAAFEAGMEPAIMEGGFRLNDFLAANEPWLKTVTEVLELAMMLETQALDLYLRFAEKSQEEGTKEVLFRLADEEKGHIKSLARLLDEKR